MYKISPTFLDSFAYYIDCDDQYQSLTARKELISRLRGEPCEVSEAMEKGIKLETDIQSAINGLYPEPKIKTDYNYCVSDIANEVQDSLCQVEVKYQLEPNVIVWGYIDFLKRNRIVDVKYTKSYDIGKYNNRNQHLVYLLALKDTGIKHFSYLISDLKRVYREDYDYTPQMETTLKANVREFLDYLENDNEMKQAFMEKNK